MSEQKQNLLEHVLQALCLSQQSNRPSQSGPVDDSSQKMANAFIHFMDEMPGGFLIYYADQGEEIIYANQALLRICQCQSIEEFRVFTNNSFRGLVHPGDLAAVEQSIQMQISASQYDLDYVEYRIQRKDGAIRWIEDYGHFAHLDQVGDIFYVFLGDATEKRDRMLKEQSRLVREKQAEEQKLQNLIEEYDKERSLVNQEYLQQLEVIEGLSINYESICYVDLELDLIVPYRLSSRTASLFPGPHEAMAYSQYSSCYISTWVHPEDQEMAAKATQPSYMREKLAGSQTYYFNYRVLMGEELQYIQFRAVNVGHQDNIRQVVLGYRRVDTELQQQMQQQAFLAEALAKANLAITSKNTFLSNMSHDMRTPLHAIFGFASLAKLNLDKPEEAAGYLERLEEAGHRLLDMIDKVLQMSSLPDSVEVKEAACDLKEVADDIYAFLQPHALEKGIAFHLDCTRLEHSAVYADREKLHMLTLYLVNNAITYTKPGGQITLSITEGEALSSQYTVYRLSVEDTGIGISPESLGQIFEPFSREKNSTLSGIQGAGLGLTIAKNIVDIMGGTIAVQSEVNQGSAFTATFTFRVQIGRAHV